MPGWGSDGWRAALRHKMIACALILTVINALSPPLSLIWSMPSNAHILAERAVPRYTSYPTAPHFSPQIGADAYGAWLDALPEAATLSLYLHVPFCQSMCWYCGCHTKVVKRRDPIETYARRMAEEVKIVAARAGKRKVVHIHWGGGTPSMLGAEHIRRITEQMKDAFDFSIIKEHAIELDPRQVTAALAQTLGEIGVNRVSLGVQDFSPHVQQAIGRVQPFAEVEQAVAYLRAAGIDDINLDLMYGLPKQSLADVQETARLAALLKPKRLALFGYAHVPWFKTHQKLIETSDLPGPAERLEQAETACKALEKEGFVAIGLDHFALPDDELAIAQREGRLHRNFQGYTTDEADALIGLGASSIGRLPQGFVQNAPDMHGWARAVDAGRLSVVKGVTFSDDDLLRAGIIERLMCDFALDLDALAPGVAFDAELARLAELDDQGLIRIDGRKITVLPEGRAFVRLAAAAFDAYLPRQTARHSMAV